jgi:alpha-D-xyloside xylohydrolase
MPLHIRAGSIVPLGPHLQYAHEKLADPIELRVYRGANGHFDIYEDQGDNYDYEREVFVVIPVDWNESKATLTLGARRGSFPGMLKQRRFRIVLVETGLGVGIEPAPRGDATVTYEGRPLSVRCSSRTSPSH